MELEGLTKKKTPFEKNSVVLRQNDIHAGKIPFYPDLESVILVCCAKIPFFQWPLGWPALRQIDIHVGNLPISSDW